jgi:hypothetical protein
MDKKLKLILSLFKGKEKFLHYYLAGFVDGEGSFSVAVIEHPSQKFGWMINPCFQVYQHKDHREILELYRFVFKTGSIYRKSGTHNVLNYSIDSRRNLLEKVIPFFDRYPLVTKKETYKTFRAIVMGMEDGKHLNKSGFKKMVTRAYSMNQKGKGRKHPLDHILSSVN